MPKDASSKPPAKADSPVKTAYLILYNGVSAVAWSIVLLRTIGLYASGGPRAVFPGVGEVVRFTQSVACLEVLHSLLGIVRAPVTTTIMQVASRLLLVWGVVQPFPFLAFHPVYTSMLVAWSVTEVIRYSFFACTLSGWRPQALTWLRYNTFFILYPLGIGSECALMWMATKPAAVVSPLFQAMLYGALLVYVPGSYILYTHMMAQRSKVMRSNKANNEAATK